jgi:hypothetical protein
MFELDACGVVGGVNRHRLVLKWAALYRKSVGIKGIIALGVNEIKM